MNTYEKREEKIHLRIYKYITVRNIFLRKWHSKRGREKKNPFSDENAI